MVIAGILLLILAVCGILRPVTFPLGLILVTVGVVWDIIHFIVHGVSLIF